MAEKNPALLESGLARDGSPGAFMYGGKNRKPVFSAITSEKNSGVINTKRFIYVYISMNAARSSYHKVLMAVWIYETLFCQDIKLVFSTAELLETLLKRRHQAVYIQAV